MIIIAPIQTIKFSDPIDQSSDSDEEQYFTNIRQTRAYRSSPLPLTDVYTPESRISRVRQHTSSDVNKTERHISIPVDRILSEHNFKHIRPDTYLSTVSFAGEQYTECDSTSFLSNKSLLSLDVSENHLELSSFSSFPNLLSLTMKCCGMTEISSLTRRDAHFEEENAVSIENQQSPPSVSSLHHLSCVSFWSLTVLDLSHNSLGIAALWQLSALPALQTLDLSSNQLSRRDNTDTHSLTLRERDKE